jgi:hypothetical protein
VPTDLCRCRLRAKIARITVFENEQKYLKKKFDLSAPRARILRIEKINVTLIYFFLFLSHSWLKEICIFFQPFLKQTAEFKKYLLSEAHFKDFATE